MSLGPRQNDAVKLCYCDESGTGDEPIATMAGIVVDSQRMHLTKAEWSTLLSQLSAMVGREVTEFHTRDFYPGNGVWRGLDGPKRANVISTILQWLTDRKHHVVYAAVSKSSYFSAFKAKDIPDELNTIWRFMGFHLVLSVQKHCQRLDGTKGNTILVFDNEEREKMRFTDLIMRPPPWSDGYYSRKKKQEQLDQVIDAPFFADSQDVGLIQVADLLSFLLRRFAEVSENLIPARYYDEAERLESWVSSIRALIISTPIYPKRGRQYAENLFFEHAPPSLRF